MPDSLDLSFLYHFASPTHTLAEVRINGLSEGTSPGTVYHWLLYHHSADRLERRRFKSMGSEGGTEQRCFEQGELEFEASTARLKLEASAAAAAGGASHELSFDVADASTMADQLVSHIQLYVANVVSGLPPRMHPANHALRLGLELAALTSLGVWGLDQADGAARYGLLVGVPAAAAGAWGTFTVPNDPSRGGKGAVTVPGWARLGVELGVFGFATWAMVDTGRGDLAVGYAATVGLHHVLSFRRIRWLLRR